MNRETYPATQSPLTGDVVCTPSATRVTVTGLQSVPVDPTSSNPTDGDELTFDQTGNGGLGWWTHKPEGNVAIKVNGVTLSDDYQVFVNGLFIQVNGVQVAP